MQKLISLPNDLCERFDAIVPAGQRSKVVVSLMEREVAKREKLLYESAVRVEENDAITADMAVWNVTLRDGLENESW